MSPLQAENIISFLKENIEPIDDNISGKGYRASVYLTDGTFLPCVTFYNNQKTVDLAIRRFKEEQSGKSLFSKSSGMGYRDIVKTFVTSGNCINHYDIAKVERSKFAFPNDVINQIHGETKMGWTGFVAKMKDGEQFAFGTDWHIAFFNMPDGYVADDIQEIINLTYIDNEGGLKSHHSVEENQDFSKNFVFKSKPFFECYLENL